MNNNIDINTATGVALAEIIKSSFNTFLKSSTKIAKEQYGYLFEDFKPYMEECYYRNRNVRILCQGDDDVDLLSIYVETYFSNKNGLIRDTELIININEAKNHVITGAGGAGKTFFMRKLWLDLIGENKRFPLYIELRKLNELSSASLETFIRASISSQLTDTLFEKFCKSGHFIFILDGFDELPKDLHEIIQQQILSIAEKYDKCGVVVSSRPDGRFSGWTTFKVYDAEPFKLEQTKELCSKIPFDKESQRIFVKRLNESFYENYKSFLSNPLLSVMMMMIFKRHMDISQKMGIFYDEAFGTLYQFHDTTKAYNRKKHLDIQTFRKSFGVFCLLSYAQEKFDFSRTELDTLIENSNKLINLHVDKSDVLDDYERNVNLIRQDGLRYYFIHRSFQEYFAAWALTNVFPNKFEKFSRLIDQRYGDKVIRMCYDLQRSLVVTKYIAPKLEAVKSRSSFKKNESEDGIWDKYIPKMTCLIDSKKTLEKRKLGAGLSMRVIEKDPDLLLLVKVMTDVEDYNHNDYYYNFYHTSVHKLFSPFKKWIDQIETTENLTVKEVEFKPNFKKREVLAEIIDENKNHKNVLLPMTDSQFKYLKDICGKHFSEINKVIEWCESEIAKITESNDTIDEMFFND